MVILHKVRLVIFFNRVLEPKIHHRSQGCFPHQQAILTPAESPKFNSILTLPRIELDSTGCGFSPYPGTLHTHSDASLKSMLLPALLTSWLYIRGSQNPTQPFSSINLLESHTTQGTRSLTRLVVYYRI